MIAKLYFTFFFIVSTRAQGQGLLMSFLDPEKIGRMMQLATDLTSAAAKGVVNKERDALGRIDPPEPIDQNAPPSTLLAQGIQSMLNPTRQQLLNALGPPRVPDATQTPPATVVQSTVAPFTFPTFATFAPFVNPFTQSPPTQTPTPTTTSPPSPAIPTTTALEEVRIPARPLSPAMRKRAAMAAARQRQLSKRHPAKKARTTTTPEPDYTGSEEYLTSEEYDLLAKEDAAKQRKAARLAQRRAQAARGKPPIERAEEEETPRRMPPLLQQKSEDTQPQQVSAVQPNPLLRLAQTFLGGATGSSSNSEGAELRPSFKTAAAPNEQRAAPVFPQPSQTDLANLQKVASAFMGGQFGGQQSPNGDAASGASASAAAASSSASAAGNSENTNIGGFRIPTIKDFIPGASDNFGFKKGEGCLPFLSEFMQVAYGNCQRDADQKAFDAWGGEIKNAILEGRMDLLGASKETCKRTAERQSCARLRQTISDCDIIQSLQIGTQLQREMKRCEEVTGIIDQNPMAVLGQVNNLLTGEVAQGFFSNFLKG